MWHKWFYKDLGDIPDDIYNELYDSVPGLVYHDTKNLKYSIAGNLEDTPEFAKAKRKLLNFLEEKFFNPAGHLGTNCARMSPMCYCGEHNDNGDPFHPGQFHTTTVKILIPIITSDRNAMTWIPPNGEQPIIKVFRPKGIYIVNNIVWHSVVNLNQTEDRYFITARYNVESVKDPSTLENGFGGEYFEGLSAPVTGYPRNYKGGLASEHHRLSTKN